MSVELGDLFDGGVLAVGAVRYQTDEVVIYDPWAFDLVSVLAVISSGSPARSRLGDHLAGLSAWIDTSLGPETELWVRGTFASTQWPDVDSLDIVLFYDAAFLDRGAAWMLQVLAAGPLAIYPGEMSVVALRQDDSEDASWARDREARRSSRRVRDPNTDTVIETGWLRIVKEGG